MLTGRRYGGTGARSIPSSSMRPAFGRSKPRSVAAAWSCRTPTGRAEQRTHRHKYQATDGRRPRHRRTAWSELRCAARGRSFRIGPRRKISLRCDALHVPKQPQQGGNCKSFCRATRIDRKNAAAPLGPARVRGEASVGNRIGERCKECVLAAIAGKLAWLRAVIVAELHQRPRLRYNRNQPVVDRLR